MIQRFFEFIYGFWLLLMIFVNIVGLLMVYIFVVWRALLWCRKDTTEKDYL
jgi:hypothetical protein